jgi:hypothetical protein
MTKGDLLTLLSVDIPDARGKGYHINDDVNLKIKDENFIVVGVKIETIDGRRVFTIEGAS